MTQPINLFRKVPLSNGGFALVDAEDYDRIKHLPWHQHKRYAVYSTTHADGKRENGRLHRIIMKAPKGTLVDHKNGNRLDCRKDNLRLCNEAGNARNAGKRKDNTSGFKGVTFHKDTGKWQAAIRAGGNPKYLGLFDTPEAAAKVYDTACVKHHGEFAKNNQIICTTQIRNQAAIPPEQEIDTPL